MNNTHYYFIPYLREGLTAAINQSETAGQRPEIDVTLKAWAREMKTGDFKPVTPIRQKIQLYGPGDVLGFHNRIVVQTDPVHNTGNFEPNYFPAIEFAEPDFAWRFTAEPADDIHGSLTPWITLIVLIAEKGQEEFTDETSNSQSKVPCIKVDPDNLPDLEYAWQWAHVQVTSEQDGLSEDALKGIINDHPEQAICRLMSPRRLRPQTLYSAFVVPTFKLGMAATGIPGVVRDGLNANDKSWTKDSTEEITEDSNGEITLPYYYKWEFRTSIRGDFEYLLRLLKPRDLTRLGTRDMNCKKPGYGITGINRSGIEAPDNHILKLEGALQAFETEYTPWGNDKKEPTPEMFQEEVAQKLLNKPARDLGHATTDQQSGRFTYLVTETSAITDIALSIREDGKSVRFTWKTPRGSDSRIDYGLTSEYGNYEARNVLRTDHTLTLTGLVPQKHYFFKISALNSSEIVEGSLNLPELPSVVPPIYGRWHCGKQTVDPRDPDKWINTLNLDPRHRAAAGLGAQVIKKQQEALMASAWEQLGDLLRANRTLSRAQVGRDSGINLHRRISELHLDQFLFYTAPVQKRITMENPCTKDDNEQPRKISVDQFIKRNTQIPLGMMDPAFRCLARKRGPLRKRQKRAPAREDLFTRVAQGGFEPAGPHPRPGGMLTPCIISHLLVDRITELFPPEKMYTLEVEVNGFGSVTVNPSSDPLSAGTKVTIIANPSPGSRFAYWLGIPVDGLTDSVVPFEMEADYNITAVFTEIIDGPVADDGSVTDDGPVTDDDLGIDDETSLSLMLKSKSSPSSPTSDDNGTHFCEDKIKDLNIADYIAEQNPFDGIEGISDPEKTAQAVQDALVNWLNKTTPSPDEKTYQTEFLENIRSTIHSSLDPEQTITERVKKRLRLSKVIETRLEEDKKRDPLDSIMAAPEFPQPMYEPLRDLSQDHLLPGVETVPQNTLGLLKTNRRFLESYMVGCNHEFAGELLWRRYPTDQRGNYFRQFWDVDEYIPEPDEIDSITKQLEEHVKERLRDIQEIHLWSDNKLGLNPTQPDIDEDEGRVVLLVRGDLLKRYPNTVIYAVDAIDLDLFNWYDVPGTDEVKLKDFLMKRFGTDWVETANIEKSDDAMTLNISSIDNYISLKLNEEKTKVSLIINDGRTLVLNTRTENSKLNIYFLRPEMEEFLKDYSDEYSTESKPYFPQFKGTLSPDLTFIGFSFDEAKARGDGVEDHGVYFIIEERVSETRFGLDLPNESSLETWDDLCWKKVNLGTEKDYGEYIDGCLVIYQRLNSDKPFNSDEKTWEKNSSSATRAWITMQKPVRIAIHASQMLP